MAEKLTRAETDTFDKLSIDFEKYDRGLDTFSQVMRHANTYLNDNDGRDSMSYEGTLLQLNDQWEFLDQTATLSGKIYVLEDDAVLVASGNWDGPYSDSRGTFYMVDSSELVSLGIIDTMRDDSGYVDAGGVLHRPVELAYGFNPDDMQSDEPMFFARPDDILQASYETPTIEALTARLHKQWPDEMALLNKRIDKAGFDPAKLVKKMRKTIGELQGQLVGNDELRAALARYIHERIELDKQSSYGVTIEGDAWYSGDTDDMMPIHFDVPSLHYLKAIGVSLDEHTIASPKHVGMSLAFAVPTAVTEGEGIDGQILVPLESIKNIFATRPMGSIRESVRLAVEARDHQLEPVEATISLPESDEPKELHPRIAEYYRLEALKSLLENMQAQTQRMRQIRHSNAQDALSNASTLARWFHQEMLELKLETSDLIRVSGPGVVKAKAIIRKEGMNLRVEVDEENPMINPTMAADTYGSYEGIIAEIDRFEDDEGKEFWQIAPKINLTLEQRQMPLVMSNFPLLSAAVKSSASVRLDNSTEFEVPELEKIRKRNETLTMLALAEPKSQNLSDMHNIVRALMNERPDAWNEAGTTVKRIRRLAAEVTESPEGPLMDAFREQFLHRRVQITGDTWIANGRSDNHLNDGVITDIFKMTLPDGSEEVIANIVPSRLPNSSLDQAAAAFIILRTVSSLKF